MSSVISWIGSILYLVLLLYFFVMWGRFINDHNRTFNHAWGPPGAGRGAAEFV